MSDDREQNGDPGDDEPQRFDGDEEKGIGLTEEFARLEQEIERELGPAPDQPPGSSSDPSASADPPESSDAEEDAPPEPEQSDAEHGDEQPEPDEGERGDEGPEAPPGREVRFDETESSEWVVPAAASGDREDDDETPPAVGETEEWDIEAGYSEGPESESEQGGDPGTGAEDADADAPPDDEEPLGDDEEPGEDVEGVQGDPPTEIRPAGDIEEPVEAEQEPVSAATGPEQPIEHTVIRTGPPPGGAGPPITGGYYYEEDDLENKTPALWWRFLTGSVLIVASVATAVAVSSLIFITGVAADLQPIPSLQDELAEIEPGDPQTILIVGSDKRADTPGDPGRSDTAMLLRVDPDNDVLSLLSIPRDLKVQIPGTLGETKFNEAYTIGGIKKTVQTVEDVTGLEINNVVNVDFNGFAKAVDVIDCVYVDVDRRYFNDNSTALSEAETYAAIHINAGYQRLCGQKALDYVRYRHADNDFVRGARQQDFLRNARAQVPVSEVLPILEGGGKGSDLLKIFTEHTQSNIADAAQLIDILKTFVNVVDVPINEVHMDATDVMENGVAYVIATDRDIEKAVDEFLGGGGSAGPRGGKVARTDSSGGGEKKAKKKQKKKEKEQDPREDANVIATADLAAITDGIDNFAKFGRTSARRLKFPVWMPTVVVPGSTFSSDSRQYEIKDPDGKKHPAYKAVIQLGTPPALTEYYGIEGTSWSEPPILNDPSETREISGREYELFYDGDRLRMVAFQDEDDNSYWVTNTLLQTLGEGEMLAIATSMEESRR